MLLITYVGGWPFALLVLTAGVISQHEFYGIARQGGARPFTAAGLITGGLVFLIPMVNEAAALAGLMICGVVVALPFMSERRDPIADLSITLTGVLYPALMLASATALRQGTWIDLGQSDTLWLLASVLIMVWTSDTFAYFVGRSIGKHPLAPKVSPKKTWEGTIGGAAGALIAGAILKTVVLGMITWIDILILALICGGLGQIGDLAQSRLKRAAGVKDSGTILPGHGGMFDRLDSIIVAMPVAWLFLILRSLV